MQRSGATGHSGPIDRFGRPGETLNFIAGSRMWNWLMSISPRTSYGSRDATARGWTGANWLRRVGPVLRRSARSSTASTKPGWLTAQW